MRDKSQNLLRERSDLASLRNRNMRFLLSEGVDRTSYDIALKSIEPLSEIEDIVTGKMPETSKAIRSAINDINNAVTKSPGTFTVGTVLDDSQRNLVNVTTRAEILKFAMLNAMDGLRMLFISEFKKKEPKFFSDEALVVNVSKAKRASKSAPEILTATKPKTIPFSQISSMTDYDVVYAGRDLMVIMKEPSAGSGNVTLMSPSGPVVIRNIGPGKLYVTGKNADGDPSPISIDQKSWWLGISVPTKGSLDEKLSALATSKGFDISDVVSKNFKVPRKAESMLTSIYRKIRMTSAIQISYLTPDKLAAELSNITLLDFKNIFEKIVEKTSGAKGDLSTQDFSDVIFFSGLAAVSSALGLSKVLSPSAEGSGPVGSLSGSADDSGGAPEGGDSSTRKHSLRNILMHPGVVKGDTDAERAKNLAVIDQDGLKRALNKLTGRNVVFTEGIVDRWRELAGIKETKS